MGIRVIERNNIKTYPSNSQSASITSKSSSVTQCVLHYRCHKFIDGMASATMR